MLTFKEQVALGESVLNNIHNVQEINAIDLSKQGINAAYVFEKTRGGMQVIVGSDGSYLVGNSSKSLEQLIEDFKNKANNNTYFQNIFTVENKKDPVWEIMCRDIALNVISNLEKQGKTNKDILISLSELTTLSQIEEFIINNGGKLPESQKTKDSILSIFKNKISIIANL